MMIIITTKSKERHRQNQMQHWQQHLQQVFAEE